MSLVSKEIFRELSKIFYLWGLFPLMYMYICVCVDLYDLYVLNNINKLFYGMLNDQTTHRHLTSCISAYVSLHCTNYSNLFWRDFQSISQCIHFSFNKWHWISLKSPNADGWTDALDLAAQMPFDHWVFTARLNHQCVYRERKHFLWLFHELPVRH